VIRDAYLKVHPICELPGCGQPASDVDHRLSRRRGGTDDWSNLQALCHRHHSAKTAAEDGGFGNRPANDR
jgi:5-methylcytosine-specific restriction endonuclease McrA